MADFASRENLQPALLDRLTDDEPHHDKPEPRELRLVSKSRLREAVLRDMRWLFNATRLSGGEELAGFPYAQRSVINFGLPALAGESAASLDITSLESNIKDAIQSYEPRILSSTLDVRAMISEAELSHHNIISIEIRGSLWAHPVPIQLLLRTDVDLETGEVQVRDLNAPGPR